MRMGKHLNQSKNKNYASKRRKNVPKHVSSLMKLSHLFPKQTNNKIKLEAKTE